MQGASSICGFLNDASWGGEGRGGDGEGEEAFISAKLYIGMTFGTYQYLDLEHPHTWKFSVDCHST